MPDISMCANEKCTLKNDCYRYTAKPDEFWQQYGSFKQDDKGECRHYRNNKI